MPAAEVFSASAGSSDGGSSVATSSVDSTGSTYILISVATSSGVAGSPEDSKSNSWTLLSTADNGDTCIRVYGCQDPTVGSGHTFEWLDGGYPSIVVIGYSGAGAYHSEQHGSATGGGIWEIALGTVTPPEDGCILYTACHGYTLDPTVDVGTVESTVSYSGGQHWPVRDSYEIQTTATARAATWQVASPRQAMAACIVVIRPSAAATGQPYVKRLGGVPYMAGLRQNHGVRRW